MRDKYFNDALIGNSKVKASFTKNGELIRLLYGGPDYKQFVDTFHTGIKVNDSLIIYLHEDVNNTYSQEYVPNTNILKTEIYNSYFKVKISQTDFAPINENFLVKKYVIKNENNIDLNINFLAYSKIFTDLNNDTSGYVKNESLIQYNHDFSVATFSNQNLLSFQVNGALNDFSKGVIGGKDYVGMSQDSAISYDLNVIKPGESKEINLFMYVNNNAEKDVFSEIERIRNLDVEKLLVDTINFWKLYVEEHDKLHINSKSIDEKIKKIYNRSILLFYLLTNESTGGISAGIEVDENKTKCGRYSYCWPRDAVFITEALDIVGMEDVSDKFYSEFCKKTQSANGMWEQRFYTDGRLAPSWGYQIDETASVIFGMYAHYKFTKNKNFLIENLQMLENAKNFLIDYTNDLLSGNQKFQKSYDLWEEFEGNSLYSISAVFASFRAMSKVYSEIDNDKYINEIEYLQSKSEEIKQYCTQTFYDNEKNAYVRNLVDKRMDMSIIGSIVPFKMFDLNDTNVQNTIDRINSTIRTYTGGYVRYENDGYLGGKNPWPIVTLWISWYYIETGKIDKAMECFEYVVNSSSKHGFLGEQVNNETMEPCWVIGLTWSHAMFIITLKKMLEKGL